jgi:hypothetical protein
MRIDQAKVAHVQRLHGRGELSAFFGGSRELPDLLEDLLRRPIVRRPLMILEPNDGHF